MPNPGNPVSEQELNEILQQLNAQPNNPEVIKKAYSIFDQLEIDGRQWGKEIMNKLTQEDILNKLKEIQDHRKSLLYPQPLFKDPFERWLMERKSTQPSQPSQPQQQQNNGSMPPKPPRWSGAA
jgi:hypothetical protein